MNIIKGKWKIILFDFRKKKVFFFFVKNYFQTIERVHPQKILSKHKKEEVSYDEVSSKTG